MRDTYSMLHSRSVELQSIDFSIESYEENKSENTVQGIKVALDSFIAAHARRGEDWKTSVRNNKGALTNLYRAVNNPEGRKLTPPELDAIKVQVAMQQAALKVQYSSVASKCSCAASA